MPRPCLDVLNNATAFSLTWIASGTARVLTTGVSFFSAHFGPVSTRLLPRARSFGETISEMMVCDYGLGITQGDIVVIQTLKGESVTQDFRIVRGVDEFPSSYLPHATLYVERYRQDG